MSRKYGMQGRRGSLWLPWRTLFLGLLATLAYLLAGPAPEAWVFSREAINTAEPWRLVTGHWVHSDLQHATWNIIALVILGVLFEPHLKGRLFTDLLLSSFLLSLWIAWQMPWLAAYCGLSGILNTLLLTGTMALWQRYRSHTILLVAGLAVAKNLVELFSQQAIFTDTSWPSVPQAHLVGMTIGLLVILSRSLRPQASRR